MIILNADNRSLLAVAPYTYLVDNTPEGTGVISVVNTDGFNVDDFILLGGFGNEAVEIFRIGAIDSSLHTISLYDKNGNSVGTGFAYPESTKVSFIPFNEVRFYWTAAAGNITDEDPVFDTANPLSSWLDIVCSEWFTTYSDNAHSTGFGWFLFRNSVSLETSQNSNAIPYAGFSANSVQQVFADFMSLLNNKELKLVTNDDMFSWINEAISISRNKLNLSNPEYTVSPENTLSILVGTSEYLLPDDFGDLVQITESSSGRALPIPMLTISAAMSYSGTAPYYYLRGRYLGIVPTPTSTATYVYRYRSKGSRVTSLDDYIDFPDNGFYILKDWMMYRACLKFQNPNAPTYYKAYTDGLNTMIASSVKRDANLDTWGIAGNANA